MIRCPKCNRFGVESMMSGVGYTCLWEDCDWRDIDPPGRPIDNLKDHCDSALAHIFKDNPYIKWLKERDK